MFMDPKLEKAKDIHEKIIDGIIKNIKLQYNLDHVNVRVDEINPFEYKIIVTTELPNFAGMGTMSLKVCEIDIKFSSELGEKLLVSLAEKELPVVVRYSKKIVFAIKKIINNALKLFSRFKKKG